MSIGFSVSHLCTYLPGCDNWAHSQQLLNSAFRSDQGGIYLSPTLQLGQSPREKFNQISKISTANNSNDLKTNRYLFYVCSRVLNFQLQFLIFFRKKSLFSLHWCCYLFKLNVLFVQTRIMSAFVRNTQTFQNGWLWIRILYTRNSGNFRNLISIPLICKWCSVCVYTDSCVGQHVL